MKVIIINTDNVTSERNKLIRIADRRAIVPRLLIIMSYIASE